MYIIYIKYQSHNIKIQHGPIGKANGGQCKTNITFICLYYILCVIEAQILPPMSALPSVDRAEYEREK